MCLPTHTSRTLIIAPGYTFTPYASPCHLNTTARTKRTSHCGDGVIGCRDGLGVRMNAHIVSHSRKVAVKPIGQQHLWRPSMPKEVAALYCICQSLLFDCLKCKARTMLRASACAFHILPASCAGTSSGGQRRRVLMRQGFRRHPVSIHGLANMRAFLCGKRG